ncbi:sugar phosphate isomerase/epimerase [Streptacidiphilus sp. MAP12-20]|uniref:sugar phosphate isomerase/epimerase family protein n=1 Tax=Streptacidiphilus sp. MAP12-20 TaxID=3156299 RepID=UPI00351712FA
MSPEPPGIRFGVSTLGLPGLPLGETLELLSGSGYSGVELRCAPEEPVHPGLDRAERSLVARSLARAGITPIGLAGYARIAEPGPDGPLLAHLRREIWLAADIGARNLRVFPGAGALAGDAAARAQADARAVRRLRAVGSLAQTCGVRVLLETHDSHRAAADAARLLCAAGAGAGSGSGSGAETAAGALWDVLHTRLAGDEPADAFDLLRPHLGYLQVKDVRAEGDLTPVALGAGVLDPAAALAAAVAGGYAGWVVWEYEARWYPGAEPLAPMLTAGNGWLTEVVTAATAAAAAADSANGRPSRVQ